MSSQATGSGKRLVVVIFLAALLTHLAYFSVDRNFLVSDDSSSYLVAAHNWLHGRGFSDSRLRPETDRTPGYPLLLVVFQALSLGAIRYVVLFQHLLGAAVAAVTAYLVLRVTKDIRVAGVTGFLVAIDLPTIRVSNAIMTEALYTAILLLVFWLAYLAASSDSQARRLWLAAAAGLVSGAAVLVRPVGILYGLPLVLFLIIVRKAAAVKPALVLMISFALLPAMWAARNYLRAGQLTVSTISGAVLYRYTAAGALAAERSGNWEINTEKARREELYGAECRTLTAIYKKPCEEITSAERTDYQKRTALAILLRHPLGFLKSAGIGILYTMFGGGAEALSRISPMTEWQARSLLLPVTILYMLLAAVGCAYWFRINRHMLWLLLLTIAYFVLITAGAEAYSRFRVPFMPMYAMLIGGGVIEVIGRTESPCRGEHTKKLHQAAGDT